MTRAHAQRKVTLSGPLVVSLASAIQSQIIEAIDAGDHVCLDVSEATEIDTSFLQILVAAHKTAIDEGRQLTVADRGSAHLRDQLARCGLPLSALPTFTTMSS